MTDPLMPRPRVAGLVIAAALLFTLLAAWRADHHDRAQLAADLASSKQALAQATARQRTRDAQLQQALAAIAAQKASVTKPAQILHQLPKHIPLPLPVTLQTQTTARGAEIPGCSSGLPGCGRPEGLNSAQANAHPSDPASQGIVLPSADLKPLYDFALDCQACQAKLATAQADLADEKSKTAVLTRQRDDAIRIAKGGSVLRRIKRAAKWFLIGAAAGAIAAKAHP
jgi:hypothetical protein